MIKPPPTVILMVHKGMTLCLWCAVFTFFVDSYQSDANSATKSYLIENLTEKFKDTKSPQRIKREFSVFVCVGDC